MGFLGYPSVSLQLVHGCILPATQCDTHVASTASVPEMTL